MSKQDVWNSYGRAAIIAMLLLLSATIVALYINYYYVLHQSCITCIGITGAFFDIVTVYGILGHTILSWNGKTPEEQLDRTLSYICGSIGVFCTVLVYLLNSV